VYGIWEFMSPEFRNTFHRDPELVAVQCETVTNILKEAHVNFVDFFSLDVEGGEMTVLKTIDFNTIQFGLVIFEDLNGRGLGFGKAATGNTHTPRTVFERHGYVYVETYGESHWYVNPNFYTIYKNIIPENLWDTTGILRYIRTLVK